MRAWGICRFLRTSQLWELTLASLRANFRSSLSSSPLDVSAAYLLQRAGGVSAVRQDVIRFLSEAIQRKAQVEHNLRVMGEVKFTEVSDSDAGNPSKKILRKLC